MTPVICRAPPCLCSPRLPGSLTLPPAGAERAGRESEQPERGGNQRGDAHKGRPPRCRGRCCAQAQLPARPWPPRQKHWPNWTPNVFAKSCSPRKAVDAAQAAWVPPPRLPKRFAKHRAGGGTSLLSPSLSPARVPFPCSFKH